MSNTSAGSGVLPDASPFRNVLTANGRFDPAAAETEFCLEDGRVVRVATSALVGVDATVRERVDGEPGAVTIPLAEERLTVGRRVVETGTVRLRKTVEAYETALDEVLAVRSFEVERVVVDRVVDEAPAVRQEGETTVYPVVEERLVVTRELVLKEEVRVTRRDTERRDTRPVVLRREVLAVEREGGAE